MFCTTATAYYEIYTWTLCHSYLHEKITSIIQSLNKSKIAVYFWDSFMIDWIIKMGMKIPWNLHKGEIPEVQAYWSKKQNTETKNLNSFCKKEELVFIIKQQRHAICRRTVFVLLLYYLLPHGETILTIIGFYFQWNVNELWARVLLRIGQRSQVLGITKTAWE